MITYRKVDNELLETALKMRREMLAIIYGKDECEFEGGFTRLSAEYFTNGDQTTVLAFDGEHCVGCATICYITLMPTFDHPTGKRAHIMNVYTNADYRRQGIARQMMNMLLDEAKERGATYVSLDATENGRPLYKALGFGENKENMGLDLAPKTNG
ncbi:MAG: GNAT family N-acetyltransferase [Oscillospiraceae bacterium]|nr:GNAT family N-acetyltransferase [Oscillospiraceae bacterium]